MFKHILIATDGSTLSERAITAGVKLARTLSAQITGVTVSQPFHIVAAHSVVLSGSSEVYEADCERRARKYLATIGKLAAEHAIPYSGEHVYAAQPYQAIVHTAERLGCDLICMASHGRRGISALLLGSETTKVLTHSKIPVLVCR